MSHQQSYSHGKDDGFLFTKVQQVKLTVNLTQVLLFGFIYFKQSHNFFFKFFL